MHGFSAAIWISGYKDALNGIHVSRYKGHTDESVYDGGHAQGTQDRIAAADREVSRSFDCQIQSSPGQ